jgi:Zn2+/Cd2+-exporting ATPase
MMTERKDENSLSQERTALENQGKGLGGSADQNHDDLSSQTPGQSADNDHDGDDDCGCAGQSGCGCESGHAHAQSESMKPFMIRLGIAFMLTLFFALAPFTGWIPMVGFAVAYIFAGYEVLLYAATNLLKGKVFDENFLMSIASMAAFIIGNMPEAVAVMIFYGVGEILEDRAVARSRRNIADLMDIRPDVANIKDGDQIRKVSPEEVAVGQIIVVRPGEKIPLDGVVLKGESFVDTRALTGESVPRKVKEDSTVFSGAVNQDGLLEIGVTKLYGDSTVSKILALVETSSTKKAKSEQFITKFARYYTPIVVGIALLVAILPPLLGIGTINEWVYKGISFLIISCPCALVISIPVGFFGGIGGAARNGILVKGGNYLEALNQVDTLVFDKTGTLTEGVFQVTSVRPEVGVSEEELLATAATAEIMSSHPIGRSIVTAYGKPIEAPRDVKEKAGFGVTAQTKEGLIFAGNRRLMETVGIIGLPEFADTTVYVAKGKQYLGYLLISDRIKEGAAEALHKLKTRGIKNLVMLTGDNQAIADEVAAKLGIDSVRAELLPQDKVSEFEKMLEASGGKGKVAFVGDGINDAPVLARADIGIAMGEVGSDAAIEAADVVIMNDNLASIDKALQIAGKTRRIVLQNIAFALGVKGIIMVLAFLGITGIWFAIFADVGVALLAILNAVRALKVR